MSSQIAVIGIGGFGTHVVEALSRFDFNVLAIDKSKDNIERINQFVDRAMILDSTDEEALSEINWLEVDIAIVAIGDPNIEASILTVSLLRQFGVRRIISRASTKLHSRTLLMVGADEIVNPEKDMAGMLVNKLAMPNVIDMRYFDDEHVISEFIPPGHFVGSSLMQLNLRKKYNVSIVAIKRFQNGTEHPGGKVKVLANPSPGEIITEKDVLVGIGKKVDFEKIK